MGYCREAAIWLGRLTTSAVPWSLAVPDGNEELKSLYVRRHLPQGAPTSPALANLSAFGLDVRLSGLLKKFGGKRAGELGAGRLLASEKATPESLLAPHFARTAEAVRGRRIVVPRTPSA